MSDDPESGFGYLLGGLLAVLVLVVVVLLGTYAVLALGVASTVVGFLPRPGLGLVRAAFGTSVAVTVLLTGVGFLWKFGKLATEYGAGAIVGAAVASPFVLVTAVLFFHAATTVWNAVPDTYAAKVSVLFVLTFGAGSFASDAVPDDD